MPEARQAMENRVLFRLIELIELSAKIPRPPADRDVETRSEDCFWAFDGPLTPSNDLYRNLSR